MFEYLISGNRVRGVIVTTRSMSTEYDFVSRYFAPWVGIPEDPGGKYGALENVYEKSSTTQRATLIISVTGSAHTVLAPFWSSRLCKTLLRARQCSARGGELGLFLCRSGRHFP